MGTADDIAIMIAEFVPIACTIMGVKNLKIITFKPQPQDFFACNALIKELYKPGVEVKENSELDLLVNYKVRTGILTATYGTKAGHPGGSLPTMRHSCRLWQH